MDASLYTALVDDFGLPIVLVVLAIIFLIAAFRSGVKFDINVFFKSRKQRHAYLARCDCPHMILNFAEGEVEAEFLWYFSPGIFNWTCSRCGAVSYVRPDDKQLKKIAEYYTIHPDEYTKKMNRSAKHARKSY